MKLSLLQTTPAADNKLRSVLFHAVRTDADCTSQRPGISMLSGMARDPEKQCECLPGPARQVIDVCDVLVDAAGEL